MIKNNQQPELKIKPEKSVFLWYRFLKGVLFMGVFLSLVLLVLFFVPVVNFGYAVLGGILFFVLTQGVGFISAFFSYKKENYILKGDKIIRESGGIFSNLSSELKIKNITYVTEFKPYFENKIFKTGTVFVGSAGSTETNILFRNIKRDHELYRKIQDLMKENGFSITRSELIQQEKPYILGIFLQIFQNFFKTVFALLVFGVFSFGGLIIELINEVDFLTVNLVWIIALVALIILGFYLVTLIIRFLDLKLRVYYLYNDVIEYSEGFFNKVKSFIPIDNLADSGLNQNFIERMLGVYDVKLSCQGSAQEIFFTNMRNGEQFAKNVDQLIETKENQDQDSKKAVQEENLAENKKDNLESETKAFSQVKSTKDLTSRAKDTKQNLDFEYEAKLKIQSRRALIGYLIGLPFALIIFPILPFYIIGFVMLLITISATNYQIKNSSIKQTYSFINKKEIEFSIDKITAVVYKENFVDKILKTASIQFWSIGSNQEINFKHIDQKQVDLDRLLLKSGIKKQEQDQDKVFENNPKFNLKAYFLSNLLSNIISVGFLVILALVPFIVNFASNYLDLALPQNISGFIFLGTYLLLGLILIINLIIFIYSVRYYKRVKLVFYDDYLIYKKGLLFKETYYVRFDDIKDIVTYKYPFINQGKIKFNIAGERLVAAGSQGQQTLASNSFKINYLENIKEKDDLVDLILNQKPDQTKMKEILNNLENYKQKPVFTSKPKLASALLVLIVISVVIFPLIILLPITIFYTVLKHKHIFYIIEPYRVIEKKGIIFKTQTSIVFNKIDNIGSDQGFLNKIFKTGNILISTAGSSTPELILTDVKDFKKFYEVLEENYAKPVLSIAPKDLV
jgi:uncharacterized membrane protein YdbT with pleckstrin-like domain